LAKRVCCVNTSGQASDAAVTESEDVEKRQSEGLGEGGALCAEEAARGRGKAEGVIRRWGGIRRKMSAEAAGPGRSWSRLPCAARVARQTLSRSANTDAGAGNWPLAWDGSGATGGQRWGAGLFRVGGG